MNAALQSEEFLFAEERHAALLTALELPTWTVGVGFGDLERGEHFELPNRRRLD